MRTLFSVFPGGLPGVALLLLRMTSAVSLIANLGSHSVEFAWVAVGAIIIAAIVILGLLTRISAVICAGILLALSWQGLGKIETNILLLGLNSVVLAIMGAGAFSIDAKLFGHRIISLD